MHHVHLAVAALAVCSANVMAQEFDGDGANLPSLDVSFAAASGMDTATARSPLGSLAFGKVSPPVLTGDSAPFTPPRSAAKGIGSRSEEVTGVNDARPVPEPPTLLMLMAGLGVLAVVISRRQ